MPKRNENLNNAIRASRMQVSIGDRLAVSSEEINQWLRLARTGTVTVREDLTVRINRG